MKRYQWLKNKYGTETLYDRPNAFVLAIKGRSKKWHREEYNVRNTTAFDEKMCEALNSARSDQPLEEILVGEFNTEKEAWKHIFIDML